MIKICKLDYAGSEGAFSDITIGVKPECFMGADLIKTQDVTGTFLEDASFRDALEKCALVDLICKTLAEMGVELDEDLFPEQDWAQMEYNLARRGMLLAKELYPDTEFVGEIIAEWTEEEWKENQCSEAMIEKDRAWELFDLQPKVDEILTPLHTFLVEFKTTFSPKQ